MVDQHAEIRSSTKLPYTTYPRVERTNSRRVIPFRQSMSVANLLSVRNGDSTPEGGANHRWMSTIVRYMVMCSVYYPKPRILG